MYGALSSFIVFLRSSRTNVTTFRSTWNHSAAPFCKSCWCSCTQEIPGF